MKQTSVKYLIKETQKRIPPFYAHYIMNMNEVYNKALEIEKEQIEKTFVDVTKATLQNLGIKYTLQDIIDFKKIAEVYYNEEYKSE